MRSITRKAIALLGTGAVALSFMASVPSSLAATADQSQTVHTMTNGSVSTPRTAEEAQAYIAKKTGWDIKWNKARTTANGKKMQLSGTSVIGDNLSISINCTVTTNPFSIKCTIIIAL